MRSDDEAVDALRRAHREASQQLDDVPAARVRAAVLAAAARGVDAPPLRAVPAATAAPRGLFQSRRWPLPAAALLVVSVMTGLVATHAMRDSPERITTVAAITSDAPSPKHEVPASAASSDAQPALTSPAATVRTPAVEPLRNAARKPAPAPPVVAEMHSAAAVPTPAPGQSAFAAAPSAASPPASPVAGAAKAENSTADSTAEMTATRARIGRVVEPSSPQAWVERIAQLRADGNETEADRELEALRQRYPGFAIPAKALKATGTR